MQPEISWSSGTPFMLFDELGIRLPLQVIEHFANITYYPESSWVIKRRKRFKFRNGPVQNLRGSYRGRRHRRIKTFQEHSASDFLEYDEYTIEYRIKSRPCRNHINLVCRWDDLPKSRQGDGWKNYRKTRWKPKK
jgi:hypothetical protein